MNKKQITALVCSAAVLSSAATALAGFTAQPSEDGFTLGYYNEAVDEAARAETERLYANRPVADRQMENLTRGLVAVPGEGGNLVSWRFLGTDSGDEVYNLYRNGERVNKAPIALTNYFDKGAKAGAEYTLVKLENGAETGEKVTAKAWEKSYIEFPVKEYAQGEYFIDDGATGDIDGDGEYEIILRRTPKDMSPATRVAYPIIEAYKQDGTYLWTINVGPNEINEVDINMLVYDLDGDGKDEVVMRSFEGTTDGAGTTIGDVNGDGITDYSKNEANLAIFTDRQYIVSTPEFLSVYDGATGVEIGRSDLFPVKEPLSDWSYRYTDTGRLTKRASHYLFGVAYLDGEKPSVVMVRGAWDNVRAAAWHMEDGNLLVDWVRDTENKEDINSIWGACNHNMTIADVDFDGKDEILSGPMAIDHDGNEMYATKAQDAEGNWTKLLHGDAFDVAKMDPDFNGYLSWACHENKSLPANIELHDARTGQVLFGWSKNKDTGRSRAADIDPRYKGFEMWGSTATNPVNVSGERFTQGEFNSFKYRNPDGTFQKDETGKDLTATLPMNFKVYWDGDLLSEFLDGTTVSKWNWEDECVDIIMNETECASNSGTKAVPCVSADLFGDWREEIVWKTADEKNIRIYSTAIPTDYKLPTLMHDFEYRSSIATQNNHYNQPPNVSYYLGAETVEVPVPEIHVIKDGQKVVSPALNGHSTFKIAYGSSAKELELVIGSPNAYADSVLVQIDIEDSKVVPTIVDDRTLVPVRFISETFGMDVDYDEAARKVTLKNAAYEIVFTLGSNEYTINGEKFEMDVNADVIYDRTMIPLRAMAEAIGKSVYYEDGYINIADTELSDTSKVSKVKAAITAGEKPVVTPKPTQAPTPEPEVTPDPQAGLETKEYTDTKGQKWDLFVDEDFENAPLGDAMGWAGTKPAPLDTIGVATSNGSKVMAIGGSSKGNRNAIYHAPAPMIGKAVIELDWNSGECEGGSSYGELRFADSAGNVFLCFKDVKGGDIEYNFGGKISNGGLETMPWQKVGNGFKAGGTFHIVIEADFEAKKAEFTMTQGKNTAKGEVEITKGEDFAAIEVLAVRNEKNFTWATEIDNLKIGQIAE